MMIIIKMRVKIMEIMKIKGNKGNDNESDSEKL